MSQDTIHAEVNKEVCEAIGCSAQATKKIHVKIGQEGTICLYLCSNCVAKFA